MACVRRLLEMVRERDADSALPTAKAARTLTEGPPYWELIPETVSA